MVHAVNPRAPDTASFADAIGIVVAVALLCAGSRWLARRSLQEYSTCHRHIVGMALATSMLLTLAYGWMVVASPQLFDLLSTDAGSYHEAAVTISDHWYRLPATGYPDRAVFLYLLAAVHWLFGANAFVSVVVNAALVGVSLMLVVDVTRLLAGPRPAVTAAVLFAALPVVPIWGGPPLRESLVMALTLGFANLAMRLSQKPSPQRLLGMAVLFAVTARTRQVQVLAMLGGAGAGALAAALGRRRGRWALSWVLPVGALLALAALLALGPRLSRYAWMAAETTQVTYRNLQFDAATSIGGPGPLTPTSPTQLLLRLPLATVRFLWGPFPGELPLSHSVFYLEAVMWWVLTPLAALGGWLAAVWRRPEALVLATMAMIQAAIGGVTLGNYGIVSRMRLSVWVLLVPLAAWGACSVFERITARSDEPAVAAR
jgi:hypothetical protein